MSGAELFHFRISRAVLASSLFFFAMALSGCGRLSEDPGRADRRRPSHPAAADIDAHPDREHCACEGVVGQ